MMVGLRSRGLHIDTRSPESADHHMNLVRISFFASQIRVFFLLGA